MLHSCSNKISHVTVPELRLARGNSSETLSPRASLKVHRRVGTGRVSAGCGARATLALCGWGSIVIIMQSAIVYALGKHNIMMDKIVVILLITCQLQTCTLTVKSSLSSIKLAIKSFFFLIIAWSSNNDTSVEGPL